jgi:exosortase
MPRWQAASGFIGLGLIILWAYAPALWAMGQKWSADPQYSHGFLVPVFGAVLLWHRRARLREHTLRPSPWGLALVLAGLGVHLAGAYWYLDWLDMVSLLPVLTGLCFCFGGLPALRWAWPSITFLVFMLPLPYRLEVALSHPLQRFATLSSTYALQTLGFPVYAEGNIIVLEETRIGVVQACNGLGMLVTFFALATAVAFYVSRPVVDKALIVVSAIPIALLVNVVRITATAIIYAEVGKEMGDLVFHDLAGWLMMPLALGLLWLEVRVLSRLLLEPAPDQLAALFAVPRLRPKPALAEPGGKAQRAEPLSSSAAGLSQANR